MRKSVVIVLAVAIIGALGIYGKCHPSNAQGTSSASGSSNAATLGANTTSNSPPATKASSGSSNASRSSFKDGTYTGASEDTPYGTVQIAVVVSGGQITNVNFLQLPYQEGHSQEVSSYAAPWLKQETIQKQSANIDFVSGATSTSAGYQESLQAALDQAAIS